MQLIQSGRALEWYRIKALMTPLGSLEAELKTVQWRMVKKIIPTLANGQLPGLPPRHPREVLDGIFWIMRAGVPWTDLPDRYPPYTTCYYWFRKWVEGRFLDSILKVLAEDLKRRGGVDLSECFSNTRTLGKFSGGRSLSMRLVKAEPSSWQYRTAQIFTSPMVRTQALANKAEWLNGFLITVATALSPVTAPSSPVATWQPAHIRVPAQDWRGTQNR